MESQEDIHSQAAGVQLNVNGKRIRDSNSQDDRRNTRMNDHKLWRRDRNNTIWNDKYGFVPKSLNLKKIQNSPRYRICERHERSGKPIKFHSLAVTDEELFGFLHRVIGRSYTDRYTFAIETLLKETLSVTTSIKSEDYNFHLARLMTHVALDEHGKRRKGNRKLQKFTHWFISGRSLEPIVAILSGYDIYSLFVDPDKILDLLREPGLTPRDYYALTEPEHGPELMSADLWYNPFTDWRKETRIKEIMMGMRALNQMVFEMRTNSHQAKFNFYKFMAEAAEERERKRLPVFRVTELIKDILRETDSEAFETWQNERRELQEREKRELRSFVLYRLLGRDQVISARQIADGERDDL